jgi:hypothetical protein
MTPRIPSKGWFPLGTGLFSTRVDGLPLLDAHFFADVDRKSVVSVHRAMCGRVFVFFGRVPAPKPAADLLPCRTCLDYLEILRRARDGGLSEVSA